MTDMARFIKRDRRLINEDDVLTQNAWDDAEWTNEMVQGAERRLQEQRTESKNYNQDISLTEENVTTKWNEFYAKHEDKFFRDRKWIFSEFPELLDRISDKDNCKSQKTHELKCNIFEVGCGVGNAVVHILNQNELPILHIYCCDLSENAIKTLSQREFYQQHSNQVVPFQADICRDFESKVRTRIELGSIDFIMLIFTLSALKPESMKQTIRNLVSLLKPDGMIFFRDYARYDLTQLRFKSDALLRDNYYMRSDGTTSYFFTLESVRDIFVGHDDTLVEVELKQDNRLLVNRRSGVKMQRCWIQAKFVKR